MPRMKDDEVRFRKAVAATGKRIADIDPLELAKQSRVNPGRAVRFARKMAAERVPAPPAAPVKPTSKRERESVSAPTPAKKPEGKPDADVQG